MLSFFWKNAFLACKKEKKWADQLDKINFFVYCSILAHCIFLIFFMKSETIKGYKLSLNPFIRKILVLKNLAIFGGKIDVLVYFSILPHYIFLIFCMKLEIINGLVLSHYNFVITFCSRNSDISADENIGYNRALRK